MKNIGFQFEFGLKFEIVFQTPKDPTDKKPVVRTVRDFSDDGNNLSVDLICGGVVAKQTFVRIE